MKPILRMHTRTKIHWLLVVLLGTASPFMQAQTTSKPKPTALMVTYVEGPAEYRPSNRVAWQPLDNRAQAITVQPQYEFRLSPKAVVVLAQPGKEPVVIRNQTGVIGVGTLLKTPPDEVSSALGGYFKYLWYNLRHHHESIESYAQGYMKRKGVVSRGEGCTPPLMLMPDYGAAIPGDSALRFSWKKEPGVTTYTLAIYDNYDDKANQLYRTDVADTTLLFTLDKPFLEKDVTYYWTVSPVGKPNCVRYTFSLPKSEVFRQLEAIIAALQQKLPADLGLAFFVQATLYEGSRFYPEAYRAYFHAYRLAPNNQLYRDGLALFLARRGMTEQAKVVLAVK